LKVYENYIRKINEHFIRPYMNWIWMFEIWMIRISVTSLIYSKTLGASIKDVRSKGTFLFLVFWESVLDSDTPPLVYRSQDRNIFCVSDVFTRYTVRTPETGEGGYVCQMDDVRQGGHVFDGWLLTVKFDGSLRRFGPIILPNTLKYDIYIIFENKYIYNIWKPTRECL